MISRQTMPESWLTSRHNAWKKNTKRKEMSKVTFITTFNPVLHSIEGLMKKHIHYLHSNEVFSNKPFQVISFLLFINVTEI